MNLDGYSHLDVEEIIKESDTAFLLRFYDGEQGWLLKNNVAQPTSYSEGDRNITMQLVEK